MKYSILLLYISFTPAFANPEVCAKDNIFAVEARWCTQSESDLNLISKEFAKLKGRGSKPFDPDCFYRKMDKGICDQNYEQSVTDSIDKMAAKIKEQTQGVFNVEVTKDSKIKRDYGGIAQGFVLEKIARKMKTPWFGNFSGDIYLSPGYRFEKEIFISDPVTENYAWIKVKFKSGWLIGTSSTYSGAKIRNKEGKANQDQELQKVVLFADSKVNGAHIDAWSTAIMAGKKPLIRRFLSLKPYEGLVGAFWIDLEGKLHCSPNIKCNFNSINYEIILPW